MLTNEKHKLKAQKKVKDRVIAINSNDEKQKVEVMCSDDIDFDSVFAEINDKVLDAFDGLSEDSKKDMEMHDNDGVPITEGEELKDAWKEWTDTGPFVLKVVFEVRK